MTEDILVTEDLVAIQDSGKKASSGMLARALTDTGK